MPKSMVGLLLSFFALFLFASAAFSMLSLYRWVFSYLIVYWSSNEDWKHNKSFISLIDLLLFLFKAWILKTLQDFPIICYQHITSTLSHSFCFQCLWQKLSSNMVAASLIMYYNHITNCNHNQSGFCKCCEQLQSNKDLFKYVHIINLLTIVFNYF